MLTSVISRGTALCKEAGDGSLTRIATCQISVTSDGKAPEWVQLLPAGSRIEAQDGRVFSNPNPDRVVARFQALGIDIPFDYEHGSEVLAPQGMEAPASGWIKRLENRNGEIWAKVEWTSRGAAAIAAKDYKYVSPAVAYEKEGDVFVVTGISSAAITTHPAITTLKALSSKTENIVDKDKPSEPSAQPAEDIMNKLLAKLFGLKEDADDKEVETAAKKFVEDHEKMAKEYASLKDKHSDLMKAKASADSEIATLRSGNADPKLFVARAELDLALSRVAALEKDGEDRRKADLAAEVETEIAAARKAGKITPAQVEDARVMCSREGGLADFRKLMSKAVAVAPDRIPGLDGGGAPPEPKPLDQIVLTSADRKVMAQTGITEDEYKKNMVKLAQLRAARRAGQDEDRD